MAGEILTSSTHGTRFRLDRLKGRTVAVVGYGNQGAAHALNLRDSGIHVTVAARSEGRSGLKSAGSGHRRAEEHGFEPMEIEDAVSGADLIIVALPDVVQGEVFAERIRPAMRVDAVLGFIHGYSVRFGLIDPPRDAGVVMVAPKGPGGLVRSLFEHGRGLPCLLAVEQENRSSTAEDIAFAWATGIGAGRSAVIRTTFAEEAETDLFGEQAVLCGGMLGLVIAAFETLVERGCAPHLAYLECCHELKQVVDLLYRHGPSGMTELISGTAAYGAHHARTIFDDAHLRDHLRRMLDSISDGTFARELESAHRSGFVEFDRLRQDLRDHPIEKAGRTIRALMPWLGEPDRSP